MWKKEKHDDTSMRNRGHGAHSTTRNGVHRDASSTMRNGDASSAMRNGDIPPTMKNSHGRPKVKTYHQQRTIKTICSFLKDLMFWWVLPILQRGCHQDLNIEDLAHTLPTDKAEHLGDLLEKNFQQEAEKRKESKCTSSSILWRALWKTFGKRYIKSNIGMLVHYLIISPTLPVCLGTLVRFFTGDATISASSAYLAAAIFILGSLMQLFLVNLGFQANNHIGMQIRIACSTLIYRKALRLPQYVGCDFGTMVTLLSNNVNRFNNSPSTVIFLLIAPLQGFLVTFILWWFYIGAASAFVPIFLLLVLPFQAKMGRIFSSISSEMTSKSDERIRVTTEALHGMAAIKMNAWEDVFESRIENARRHELRVLKKSSILLGIKQAFFTSSGKNIIAAVIVLYILTSKQINTDTIFVLVAYLNLIRENVTVMIPVAIRELSHSFVSIQRIQSFLLQKEQNQLSFTNESSRLLPLKASIQLASVKASWRDKETSAVLEDITFTAQPGCLIGISGAVAAGKSALLQTLICELRIREGQVRINGSIAYISQDPWIFQASIRENIILGNNFEKRKFDEIIRVCALDKDLSRMSLGDLSQVGERGSKLSGGQRTRVALARALYSDADIFLLDDIMPSLDAHTRTFIFHECIMKFLAKKTRLLVFSHMDFIQSVDHLIFLREGKQVVYDNTEDTYNYNDKLEHPDQTDDKKGLDSQLNGSAVSENEANVRTSPEEVNLQTFAAYLSAGFGICGIVLILLLSLLVEVLYFYSDFWVKSRSKNISWRENTSLYADHVVETDIVNWIFIYILLVGGLTIVVLCRSVLFHMMCCISSEILHRTVIKALMGSPLQYFKKTPTGRILNNLSQELGCVDDTLPDVLLDTFTDILRCLSVFVFIGMTSPVILSITLAIILPILYIARCFLIPSGCINRLEKIGKESVLAHVSSTLLGLTTIRSSNAQPVLHKKFYELQDAHTSTCYTSMACIRFLSFMIEGLMLAYMICIILAFFMFPSDTGGGDLALCLILLVGASADTHWTIRMIAETFKQMISVEKILSFTKLPQECMLDTSILKPSWPDKGRIAIKNVSLRYEHDIPPAITDINLQLNPKHKVGIVGRTGSGKTSLLNALLKLAPTEGEIYIDNINTANISVRQLRQRISVTSQEPFLFNASVRMNLDPTGGASDQQVHSAIKKTHLEGLVASLPHGLNTIINGKSLSAGEKQLMCLARAIVKRSRIVILDEATANIDPRTDTLIRTTVKKEFKNCSVITIAHRLQTVMDCDTIITMENGKIKAIVDRQ